MSKGVMSIVGHMGRWVGTFVMMLILVLVLTGCVADTSWELTGMDGETETAQAEEDWEYYELPEDCLAGEVYDEVDQLCYEELVCDEDGVCEGDGWIDLFFELAGVFLDVDLSEGSENYDEIGEVPLVTYVVEGNRIADPELGAATADLIQFQEDTALHEKIWVYFATLFPPERRPYLSQFVIFTDGPENVLASVSPDPLDPTKWVLAVDPQDAADPTELTYTLIHEYAHLLTLNEAQVPPDLALALEPDNDTLYDEAVNACPTYFPGEGCALDSAYIDDFVERFWGDLYAEWEEIAYMEDEIEAEDALYAFYEDYQDQFVSDYAPTSPEEDIAEAFSIFIMQPKPAGETIAEEKVLFFYDYPELVEQRAELVSRLYSRLRRR